MLIALQQWGNRYLADPAGPPIEFAHRDCGEPVNLVVRCAAGHDLAGNREIVGRTGPGAVRRTSATGG